MRFRFFFSSFDIYNALVCYYLVDKQTIFNHRTDGFSVLLLFIYWFSVLFFLFWFFYLFHFQYFVYICWYWLTSVYKYDVKCCCFSIGSTVAKKWGWHSCIRGLFSCDWKPKTIDNIVAENRAEPKAMNRLNGKMFICLDKQHIYM